MYKNQLQELAQRSCFNLPSYTCIREGPDHAPRFKATVNFNGEIFESPQYCSTLRQAEHSAAEVALGSLSHRGPSHSLAAKILVSFSYFSSVGASASATASVSIFVFIFLNYVNALVLALFFTSFMVFICYCAMLFSSFFCDDAALDDSLSLNIEY